MSLMCVRHAKLFSIHYTANDIVSEQGSRYITNIISRFRALSLVKANIASASHISKRQYK